MKKTICVWLIVFFLGVPLLAKAVAPILIAEGVELILAGGSVVELPAATAAGVSAAWTGVVTSLASAAIYFGLKDSSGANSVAVPSGSGSVPAPAAPATASGIPVYTYTAQPYGFPTCARSGPDIAAAAAASISACGGFGGIAFCSSDGSATSGNWYWGQPCGSGAAFAGTWSGSQTGSSCPSGYTLVSGSCNLSNSRAVTDDHRCDLSRSGASWSYQTGDINCSSGSPMRGAINGDTITVQGKDSFGNSVINSIQAMPDGGTMLHQQVEVRDANGNTAIVDKTARFDPSGNYVGQTQALLSGSLGIDPTTGTISQQAAPSGSAAPSSLSNMQLPNDYARENTLQNTNAKLQTIHDDLTATPAGPSDPAARTASEISANFFPSTFTALKAWTLPAHSSICPTITFNVLDMGEHTVDSHCQLITDNFPLMSSMMLVVWALTAMFVVLRA